MDYLIPNRRPAAVRRRVERSDKVMWDTVKCVAARVGVRCHVHALRAAFAVQFDEMHPGHGLALKDLMGHARFDTTLRHYLRRRDKARHMEAIRDPVLGLFRVSVQCRRGAYGIRTALQIAGF
jgi:integrase